MPESRSAQLVMDEEFLEIRAKILEVAASFDRLDRATGNPAEDARWQRLRESLGILLEEADGRAERIQLHFSRPYEDNWRASMGVQQRGR